MTSQLTDAVYLARISDVHMRVGRIAGRWRLKMCDRGWRLLDDSLPCELDRRDEDDELLRVAAWVARLIRVAEVDLLEDPRRPGTYVVSVEG